MKMISVRTFDSMTNRRSRDTVIGSITPAESAANAERVRRLIAYNPGQTYTGERLEEEFDLSTSAEPDDINGANRKFWNSRQGKSNVDEPPARRTNDSRPMSIQDIQKANDDFWADRKAVQDSVGRKWGQG
jgi:hypothetical protein